MNEFFSWSFLATFAGAVTATTILTQFTKTALSRVPTQLLSYVIACVVLATATAATGGAANWTVWALVPLNAVLVSLSSNGAYEVGVRVSGGG